jgi:hypothetical protein
MGDAELGGLAAGSGPSVYEQGVVGQAEVVEVAGCVAVGGCCQAGVSALQGFEAAGFLFAAAVGGRETAIEVIAVPPDAGADYIVEAQCRRYCGDVKVGAGAHQDQARALSFVLFDRVERVGEDSALQERWNELGGPGFDPGAGLAPECQVDKGGLYVAVIPLADDEQKKRAYEGEHGQRLCGDARREAHYVGQ